MIDRDLIIRGIEKAKQDGYAVRQARGAVDVEGRCCCALSAAAMYNGLMTEEEAVKALTTAYRVAANRLGMTSDERTDFITGFDTAIDEYEDSEAFLFGRELQKFIDV